MQDPNDGQTIWRISSFFDLWPELSTDSGETWQPFDGYLRIELENTLVSNYSLSASYPSGGDLVPTDQISLNFTKISFGDGPVLKAFDVRWASASGRC